MKLDNNLKERIDQYFAGMSAEDLYCILTDKYNFIKDDVLLVSEGEYQNMNDTFSKMYREFISYVAEYKTQPFECLDVKFLEASNMIKDSNVVYNKECTIPFAA